MERPQLLLVDADARSLRLLEVSLRKAGFDVLAAGNGIEALEALKEAAPDLVLSDTRMPGMDGWELCKRLKDDSRFREVPFVFLTSHRAVEDKVRGLELGVDDYLTKPIYVKEIVARVRMLLQKRERERLERRDPRSGFSGNLVDLGIVDLVQTCEIGRKAGVLRCVDGRGKRGSIFFRDGRVIDAEVGGLRGEHAFYRLLDWSEGSFELEFGPVDRPDAIVVSAQGLLMEGMRRADEWSRLLENAPPLDALLVLDPERLAAAGTIPEVVAPLLPLLDGRRTLQAALDDGARDDLGALAAVIELVRKGVLVVSGAGAEAPAPEQAWFVPPAAFVAGAAAGTAAGAEQPAVAMAMAAGEATAAMEPSGVFVFPSPGRGTTWGNGAGADGRQQPQHEPAMAEPAKSLAAATPPRLPAPPQLRLVDFHAVATPRPPRRWVLPLLLAIAIGGMLLLLARRYG